MTAPEPTDLKDLRSIDARVVLRCELCGHEETHDREELIRRTHWSLSTALTELKSSCRSRCDGWMRFHHAIPWCDDPARLRRRVASSTLLNLALDVLHTASYTRAREAGQQPPVRLALRVVCAFGADAKICATYWRKVTAARPCLWDGCHNEFNWVVLDMIRRGWNVEARFR